MALGEILRRCCSRFLVLCARLPAAGRGLKAPALSLFLAGLLFAQFKPVDSQAPQDTPNYSIKVNLVRLLVSVRDASGNLLTSLNKDDFKITDSGRPQSVSVFERNTSLPLSVAVLIDTSGSTDKDLHYEVTSIQHFLNTLLHAGNPKDAFELFSFNWRTNLEVDFSRNEHKADHALHALHGEGGTSLYDAIYLASDTLSGRDGRHVMIVVTDGGDTTSYKQYKDALIASQRADTVLYPIIVVPINADAGRNTGGEHALATLAQSTGGRIFYPGGVDQMDIAFADILHELRTQYLIGFYPQDVPERAHSYHPVNIEIPRPALRISARSGYYEP
jgi:Ca-activated chloride channel family protein